MAAWMYLFLMFFYYILFQRIRSFHKQSLTPFSGTTILLTVIGTQIYDKLILSLGSVLGEGPLLQALSIPRFLFGAIFTPLLLVSAVEYINRTGVDWADSKLASLAAWLLALALVAYEFIAGLMTHPLAPEFVEGVLRYSPAQAGAPLSTLVVLGAFVLTGLILLARVRWIWAALASTVFMAALLWPGIPYAPLVVIWSEAAFFWALVTTENRVLSQPYELEKTELARRISTRKGPSEE